MQSVTPEFILASGSPRRRELVGSLGITFTIIKSDVDETQQPGEAPLDFVQRLSREKAEAVARKIVPSRQTAAVVLAADTIVIFAADTIGVTPDGEILGKPVDAEDARQMLRRLRGKPHKVCTALTLLRLDAAQPHPQPLPAGREGSVQSVLGMESPSLGDISSQMEVSKYTYTTVYMRDYTDEEIEAYLATGDPFDKAGSYAIQHPGFKPVERIEGCYNNVVGLPLCTLKQALAEIGWPGIEAPEGCDCGTVGGNRK